MKDLFVRVYSFFFPTGGGVFAAVNSPAVDHINTQIHLDVSQYVNVAICALIGGVVGYVVKLAMDKIFNIGSP